EAGPDQLLEEVCLLVGALGRAEAGNRAGAAVGIDLRKPPGNQVQRLIPGGLPEVRQHLVVVDESPGLAPAAALAFASSHVPAVAELPALGPLLGVLDVRASIHLAAHVGGQRALGVGGVAA